MDKFHYIMLRLPQEKREPLELAAKKLGLPPAVYVRMILLQELEKQAA